MPSTTHAPPSLAPEQHHAHPGVLDLEARLALRDAAMTLRLEAAGLAHAVNTTHTPTSPVYDGHLLAALPRDDDTDADVDLPPLAACLHTARRLLAERGWCRGHITDADGRICLLQAVHLAAGGNQTLAGRACALLLDVIQQEQPHARTVPSWNDDQHGAAAPLRALARATRHAAQRGI